MTALGVGTITDAGTNDIAFTGVEIITTNSGADTFTFTTNVGGTTIDSGLGTDTLTLNDTDAQVLTFTASLTGNIVEGGSTLNFQGVERVTLNSWQ